MHELGFTGFPEWVPVSGSFTGRVMGIANVMKTECGGKVQMLPGGYISGM